MGNSCEPFVVTVKRHLSEKSVHIKYNHSHLFVVVVFVVKIKMGFSFILAWRMELS